MTSPVTGDVRSRLVAAAIDVIARGRHVAMPLRVVADRAGVTTGAIQHHFGNRNGLLLAVLHRHGQRAIDRLQSRRRAPAPAPPAVARAILLEFLPLDAERTIEAEVALAFEAIAIHDPTLVAAYQEQYAVLAQTLADHLPGSETSDIELILATIGGLRTDLLLGRLTSEDAILLVDRMLTRP